MINCNINNPLHLKLRNGRLGSCVRQWVRALPTPLHQQTRRGGSVIKRQEDNRVQQGKGRRGHSAAFVSGRLGTRIVHRRTSARDRRMRRRSRRRWLLSAGHRSGIRTSRRLGADRRRRLMVTDLHSDRVRLVLARNSRYGITGLKTYRLNYEFKENQVTIIL